MAGIVGSRGLGFRVSHFEVLEFRASGCWYVGLELLVSDWGCRKGGLGQSTVPGWKGLRVNGSLLSDGVQQPSLPGRCNCLAAGFGLGLASDDNFHDTVISIIITIIIVIIIIILITTIIIIIIVIIISMIISITIILVIIIATTIYIFIY